MSGRPVPERIGLSPDSQHFDSAGVSGLTCAMQLGKRKENSVAVVAKFMPGDYDIECTSPWAGANVMP